MPIYEYQCPDCELKFEELRPLSQANEAVSCPKCQNMAKRVLSAFCSFSKDDSGMTVPTGGSGCSCCSGGSCSTCG